MLRKVEVILVQHGDDFGLRLGKFTQPRSLLADDEGAHLHDRWQLLLVKVRQLLLTEHRLDYVQSCVYQSEGSLE